MSGVFPSCPQCNRSVPFSRSLIGRGREFTCRGCGSALIVPKAGALAAILVFGFLSIFGKRLLELPFGWALVVGTVLMGAFFEYLLLTVGVAKCAATADVESGS